MSKILNMLMAFIMSFGISGSNVNPSDIPENSNFEVHFIDVGQADSALIECDGETMMIDGGNVADSNVVVLSCSRGPRRRFVGRVVGNKSGQHICTENRGEYKGI